MIIHPNNEYIYVYDEMSLLLHSEDKLKVTPKLQHRVCHDTTMLSRPGQVLMIKE